MQRTYTSTANGGNGKETGYESSTIGSAAIGHLLPLLDYVDMDGTLLLDEDIATGLTIENGQVILSGKPGLGIEYTGLPLLSS